MREIILKENWKFFTRNDSENFTVVEIPNCWKDIKGFENYNDIGIYKNTFKIEKLKKDERIFLHFGSVFRRANVKLNGKEIGCHDGYQSPFKFEITNEIIDGENELEVEVDSRKNEGELFGESCTAGFMPFAFDGITQPIKIQISDRIFAYELYTPIDIENNKAFLFVSASSNVKEKVEAKIKIILSYFSEKIEVEKEAKIIKGENSFKIEIPLEKIKLWSPENPNLYDAKVIIDTSFSSDTFEVKTGFKNFSVKGKDFILNGEPIYLLGFGDDLVFPEKRPSATDKNYYEFYVKRAKEYGFIFARHHSNFPFEVALQKYDELGLLIQPELALANLSPEQFTKKNIQICISQWKELILAYRHHPCIASWCGGNELEWDFPFSKELYKIAKDLDPFRPVQSTDGNFLASDVNDTHDYAGIVPIEYTDYLPYREFDNMFTRDDCGKPQVIHEMGNYTTVYNLNDLPRFNNCDYPSRKIQETEKIIKENGKEKIYKKALENSFDLQKLCCKLNIEKGRLSPYFSGYHLWTLNDYYETTQGLLNSFFEDKAFTAQEFKKINSQCVLLLDTKSYVFISGDEIELNFKFSKYGNDDLIFGKISVEIEDIFSTSKDVSFEGHGIFQAINCKIKLPESEVEKEYIVKIKFEYFDKIIENSWTIFSVPRISISNKKEIYIHYLSKPIFERDNNPIKFFTIPQQLGENKLLVTDKIYGGMLETVYNGTPMLLLVNENTFKDIVKNNSFKTPWWDPGKIWYLNHTNNSQYCGVIENHPATEFLPYKGSWKLDMFGNVEQAVAVDLDKLKFDVEEIIYGVDVDFHRLGYLFQFKFNKGKVLVCSFNHGMEDLKDIAVDYSIRSLINYAMSEKFNPQKEVSVKELFGALNL